MDRRLGLGIIYTLIGFIAFAYCWINPVFGEQYILSGAMGIASITEVAIFIIISGIIALTAFAARISINTSVTFAVAIIELIIAAACFLMAFGPVLGYIGALARERAVGYEIINKPDLVAAIPLMIIFCLIGAAFLFYVIKNGRQGVIVAKLERAKSAQK